MMRFYVKLRTWFVILFAVLLVVGMTAIVGLFRVQTSVERIVGGAYQNVERGRQMLRIVDAIESRILRDMAAGQPPAWQPDAIGGGSTVERIVESAMRDAENETVIKLIHGIEQKWDLLRGIVEKQAASAEPSSSRLATEFTETLLPATDELRASIDEFVVANQDLVHARGTQAGSQVRAWSYGMTAVTLLGLILMLLFNRQVTAGIILPIRHLTAFIDRVNLGDTHFRIPGQHEDDLKQLAATANRLIESFEQVTDESRRQIQIHEKRALVLIESYSQPALLVDAGTEVVLANGAARMIFTGPDGNRALSELKQQVEAGEHSLDAGGQHYTIQLLETSAVRGFSGQVLLLESSTTGET